MSGIEENHIKTMGTIAGEIAFPKQRTRRRSDEAIQPPKKWGGTLRVPPPPPEPPSVREQMENYLAFWLGVAMTGTVFYYCRDEMGYHGVSSTMVGVILGVAVNLLLRYPLRFLLRALFWILSATFIGGAMAGVGWLVWMMAVDFILMH